jgi:hypothetical protein
VKSACSGTNQGVVWFQAEHTRALVASRGPILTHSRPDPATRAGAQTPDGSPATTGLARLFQAPGRRNMVTRVA